MTDNNLNITPVEIMHNITKVEPAKGKQEKKQRNNHNIKKQSKSIY